MFSAEAALMGNVRSVGAVSWCTAFDEDGTVHHLVVCPQKVQTAKLRVGELSFLVNVRSSIIKYYRG